MTTSRRLISIGCATLLSGSVLLVAETPAHAVRLPVASTTAQAKVLKVVPGQLVKITRAKRDGFKAWAITVKREDGSIVVGYVDRRSGHVFDWTVQQAPDEPVIDLDGPDKSRKPAPLPPAVGEPLPDGATVDRPTSRDVPAPAVADPAPPAPPAPPAAPAVAASSDHGDHSDEDSSDHSSDHSSGSESQDAPAHDSESSHESNDGDDHDSDDSDSNDHHSDDRDSDDDHSDDRDSDD